MADLCANCTQMKKENARLTKALLDTSKEYVEVVNENLALRRELERDEINHEPDNPQGVWCCDTHRTEFNERK